jgi:hypothetical protein
MKAQTIGRVIGAASLAAGIFDIIAAPRLGKGIGAGEEMGGRLFQVAGAREVATGVAGLIAPASAAPVQWRLAGDLFDLVVLGYIAAPANPKRKMALLALGVVAGVAAVDFIASRQLERSGRG